MNPFILIVAAGGVAFSGFGPPSLPQSTDPMPVFALGTTDEVPAIKLVTLTSRRIKHTGEGDLVMGQVTNRDRSRTIRVTISRCEIPRAGNMNPTSTTHTYSVAPGATVDTRTLEYFSFYGGKQVWVERIEGAEYR